MGRKEGLTLEQLRDIAEFRRSAHFSPAEKAALAYAEEMTRTPVDVPDEVFADLRRHFDDEEILELSAMIGLENLRARMSHALNIPSDGFCELPAPIHPARATGSPPAELTTHAAESSPPNFAAQHKEEEVEA